MRVYARIKPPEQKLDPEEDVLRIIPALPTTVQLVKPCDSRSEPLKFHLDGVFGPSVQQEAIFKDVVPFLQSFLDGVNVCIFAYG